MATLSLSAVSAVFNLLFADRIADQIRRDVLLPNILEVRNAKNATCTWGVKLTGRTAGGAYAEGADMEDADFDAHLRKQATLAWAEYRTGAKVSGLSEAISRLNGSPNVDPSLWDDELKDATDFLSTKISADSYGGNVGDTPTEIEGLARAVDSSVTYAGLAPGSYPEWAAPENELATADLSFETLRQYGHRPVKDACGMWPRVAICDGTTFDKIGALFGDQRKYVDEIMSVGGATVNLKLRGGYKALEVDGVAYVEDRHATASTIYYMAADAARYEQVPAIGPAQAAVIVAAVKTLTGMTLQEDEVVALIRAQGERLQPHIQVLAQTGDAYKAMVKWYGQLMVRYRNRTGKLLIT